MFKNSHGNLCLTLLMIFLLTAAVLTACGREGTDLILYGEAESAGETEAEKAEAPQTPPETTATALLKPGDTYSFADRDWTVLTVCGAEEIAPDAATGGKACLLLLNEDIGPLPYNDDLAVVSWETCSLRKYLNTEFIQDTLTPEDEKRVLTVKLSNASCTYLETKVSRGGSDTMDRCFALSADETKEYGRYINSAIGREGYYSSFWLRTSMKEGSDYGALMYREGSVYEDMNPVTYAAGVHPAMWVLTD